MTTLNSTYFREIDRMAAAGPAQAQSADDNEAMVDAVAVVRATAVALAIIGVVAAFIG